MSENTFTEVTSESWFGRIGKSIKGIVIGFILFVVAFPLLWWNEGRAVNTAKKINFAEDKIVAVSADKIDKANDGKLIYISGLATTGEVLKDPTFDVSAKAIKLSREVEMYQWEEKKDSKSKKKLGGSKETTTTYTYTKQWSSELIDSNSFKQPSYKNAEGVMLTRKNPAAMKYKSEEKIAKNVTVGSFKLSDTLINSIRKAKKLTPAKAPSTFGGDIKLVDGSFYLGKDPANPQIGDMKIKFMAVEAQDVSILARQSGAQLGKYQTPYGAYEQLVSGTVGADGMIAAAKSSNSTLTWILRIVGLALMFIGLSMIFSPLSVIADVVPLIGDFVGMGTALLAFLLAAPLTLITIALAWVFYRPIVGIPLLVLALALLVVLIKKKKAAKAQKTENIQEAAA
jgi:hypothetical protein